MQNIGWISAASQGEGEGTCQDLVTQQNIWWVFALFTSNNLHMSSLKVNVLSIFMIILYNI
jgi:hypothetical protein